MTETPSIDIKSELARTSRAQAAAAHPEASVWVSANAGTGKTHVLTMRVLRLMLAGTPPERILCLTYTKAAAAEMSKRVYASLAKWVMLEDADLKTTLKDFLGREATAAERDLARTLFTRATETPGGLRVQTIHAFSERLLQRFPLEAGVTPGFAILDDEVATELRRDATDAVLARASSAPSTDLGHALTTAIAYATGERFDEILAEALRYRAWLSAAERMPAGASAKGKPAAAGLAATRQLVEKALGVRTGKSRDAIEAEIAALLSDAELAHIATCLKAGGKTDATMAAKLDDARAAASPAARAAALAAVFLKADGDPRDKFMTKKVQEQNPEAEAKLQSAASSFLNLWQEKRAAEAVEATMALTTLASAVEQGYRDAKVRRAALDFDDLIERTSTLLLTPGNAQWVLYKLDNGLDHILVDESQDTSPAQWKIVQALASEFFSGEGARPDVARTVFAVGDEKQSIYSFQGAAPKMFAATGDDFEQHAKRVGVPWHRIPLDVSFRTVAPVLDAVDRVFAEPHRTPGVGSGATIRHIAKRFGHEGVVEIWPTERHSAADGPDAWAPLDEETDAPPVVRLANRIASTIAHWLEAGERLASAGRAIEPGDILILVRKRQPFAVPMIQALKARGVPVAGADRMRLADQIVIQDMLSLGDFLVLPEDDLSLAEVLKSPMFDFDDDDLMTIAHGRKRTLWKSLLDHEKDGGKFEDAAITLKRWRKAADFRPPFEFFADLLDRDGMRTRLISRLGPDATDPLDEFLNLALTFDDKAPPSLAGFLTYMRAGSREIKRDMDHGRNEVRVMTVHGAKGLEAPIVFLPDTCSAGSSARRGGRPIAMPNMARPEATATPFVWPVKGTSDLPPIREAMDELQKAERDEYNRLLYVAMTRPRDRLYVTGFESKKGQDTGCWYELITQALQGQLGEGQSFDGTPVRRMTSTQTEPPEKASSELAARLRAIEPPEWAKTAAPREPQLTVPLAPSRLAPFETDDEGEPSPAPTPRDPRADDTYLSPGMLAGDNRFLRGTLVHALLQYLPSIETKTRRRAADMVLASRAPELPAKVRKAIADEALALLDDPVFAPVFGPGSRAEVPIVAVIPRPRGRGPALRITGQIDRLVVKGDEVLIVDYKTNRRPPTKVEDVQQAYLFQLAAYRLAIEQIYVGKRVSGALLWTDRAALMGIPSALLDEYRDQLWTLDTASLDG